MAVVAILAAFALRLVGLGAFPPGLYHDEAYNGLDALGILAGDRPVYLEANNGREPLFVYLVAGAVGVLGRTPVAVRLPAPFVGAATVAAVYALGALMWTRRHGVFAAALVAVVPWAVLLGRIGFRAGTLPLVMTLAAAATWRAFSATGNGAGAATRPRTDGTSDAWVVREQPRPAGLRWAALGGFFAGLLLYTYTAARVAPLVLLVVVGWYLARRWSTRSSGGAPGGPRLAAAVWLVTALAVCMPLAMAARARPGVVFGRPGQVSIFNPEINGGDPNAALIHGVRGAVGLFTVRGDTIPRHNIPGRPLFGPVAGLLFLAGIVGLAHSWRRAAAIVALAWLGVMLVPTILAEDAPHFLRAVGVLPAAVIVAAVGLDYIAAMCARGGQRLGAAVWTAGAVLAVGVELAASLHMLASPGQTLAMAFESAATDLARQVNTDLDRGWQGGWAERNPAEAAATPSSGNDLLRPPARRVWLDRRLRDGWTAVPFLVPEERVTLVDPYDPILESPGVAYMWPYSLELDEIWRRAATDITIAIEPGVLAGGDLDTEPRLLYITARGTPNGPRLPALAQFGNGLTLLSASVRAEPVSSQRDTHVTVETVWDVGRSVATPPTLFVQVIEGDDVVASVDAPLGQGEWPSEHLPEGLFPSRMWRAGQRFVERRYLSVAGGLTDNRRVIAGLYEWPGPRAIQAIVDDAPVDSVELWSRSGRP